MSFWSELKRRSVIKVGVAYALVGLGVGEGADIFLPQLGAPEWVVPVILAMLILGFPGALVLAWAYDVTPEGIVRDSGATAAADPKAAPGISPETVAVESRDQASPSIAVLPFADMSPEGDQEYFGDGMAEELINALTRLEGLRVAARTSSFAHKGRHEHIRENGEGPRGLHDPRRERAQGGHAPANHGTAYSGRRWPPPVVGSLRAGDGGRVRHPGRDHTISGGGTARRAAGGKRRPPRHRHDGQPLGV